MKPKAVVGSKFTAMADYFCVPTLITSGLQSPATYRLLQALRTHPTTEPLSRRKEKLQILVKVFNGNT